jgi:hypothetical protein
MLNKIIKLLCFLSLLASFQASALGYKYKIINKTNFNVYFEISTVLGSVFFKGTIPPAIPPALESTHEQEIPGMCIQSANAIPVQAPNTPKGEEVALPAGADAASYGSGFECKSKNITITNVNNKLHIAITDP